MSSNWLKWCKGLTRKSEVVQMAAALNMSRYEVAGRLMEDLWAWCDENLKVDPDSDDVVLCVPDGRALINALTNVAGFADAMTACGWLRQRKGSLVFPNFARHNGRTEKQRLMEAAKKARQRNRERDKCPDAIGTASSLLSSPEGGCKGEGPPWLAFGLSLWPRWELPDAQRNDFDTALSGRSDREIEAVFRKHNRKCKWPPKLAEIVALLPVRQLDHVRPACENGHIPTKEERERIKAEAKNNP